MARKREVKMLFWSGLLIGFVIGLVAGIILFLIFAWICDQVSAKWYGEE